MVNPTKINVMQATIFQQKISIFLIILERLLYFEIDPNIKPTIEFVNLTIRRLYFPIVKLLFCTSICIFHLKFITQIIKTFKFLLFGSNIDLLVISCLDF